MQVQPFPTRFTELVGCAVPIQQAPVGYPAGTPVLAAAVAEAGGHGMLAAVRMPAAVLEERLRELRSRTSAFGVNFIQVLGDDELWDVAAEFAPLIELYIGPNDPALVERLHAGGALVSRQVISAEEARAAEDEGCDVVVARAIEAGGRTRGGIGMLPLLDAVLDAVEIPVVAAGGIASARGVAAVLAAGADGVRVGTRFLASEEADTPDVYRDALIAARAEDTVLTDRFSADGPPSLHRVLRSALDAAEALDAEIAGHIDVYGEQRELVRFSADSPSGGATGAVEAMALYAGQSVGRVTRRQPAAEIVAELAAGTARVQPPLRAAG